MTQQRKRRKPRTKSKDMCAACGNIWCDPFGVPGSIAQAKIRKRNQLKLCPGCGEKECRCKRKGPPERLKFKRRSNNKQA